MVDAGRRHRLAKASRRSSVDGGRILVLKMGTVSGKESEVGFGKKRWVGSNVPRYGGVGLVREPKIVGSLEGGEERGVAAEPKPNGEEGVLGGCCCCRMRSWETC
jgi:hypothetical protein